MSKIVLEYQNGNLVENAGSKAPADVSTILVNNGYKRVFVKTSGNNFIKQCFELVCSSLRLLVSAKRGSLVLCQYPIYSQKGHIAFRVIRVLLKAKQVKLVSLIHDLRFVHAEVGKKQEIKELNKYDSLIIHSPQMESLLKDSGCVRPCIVLGLFDYLVRVNCDLPRRLSHTVSFAGNLSKKGFLGHLEEVTRNSKVRFLLYGRNDDSLVFGDGIEYDGLFLPDDVSSLKGSWGLVWDGPSIDDLSGKAGIYQMINSPHKASLYLVAGLPLIVSSQAAIARIVIEENLGIAIDSLLDIEKRISSITEASYAKMLACVTAYAEKLKSGHNLLTALDHLPYCHS